MLSSDAVHKHNLLFFAPLLALSAAFRLFTDKFDSFLFVFTDYSSEYWKNTLLTLQYSK